MAERKEEPSRPFKEYAGRSVVLPIAEWEQILEDLEELDDIRAYDTAIAATDESVPLDQAVREVREQYGA